MRSGGKPKGCETADSDAPDDMRGKDNIDLSELLVYDEGLSALRVVAGARNQQFSGIALFGMFVTLAIANIRRPERHKRLMVLASFSIAGAAAVRVFRLIPSITLADRVFFGTVALDLLLLAVVLIDRRATGRVHRVWLFGGAALILAQYLRGTVVPTAFWRDVTQWLAMLGA
jgi:hypothetical protein